MSKVPADIAPSYVPPQEKLGAREAGEPVVSATGVLTRNWIIVITGLVTAIAGFLGIFLRNDAPPQNISNYYGDVTSDHSQNSGGRSQNRVDGGIRDSAVTMAPANTVIAPKTEARAVTAPATPLVVPEAPSAPRVRAPDLSRKYIDSAVQRVAGTMNVAVSFIGLTDQAADVLDEAMQRALGERGMSVIPLFRTAFSADGANRRLFDGDAALASALKLKDHVDSVLIGELRYNGPAQVVNGLYLREVVLEVHAIDPSSGEVRKRLQVRGKGGGANEELSSQNAIDRLEQEVETNISEWIWI